MKVKQSKIQIDCFFFRLFLGRNEIFEREYFIKLHKKTSVFLYTMQS